MYLLILFLLLILIFKVTHEERRLVKQITSKNRNTKCELSVLIYPYNGRNCQLILHRRFVALSVFQPEWPVGIPHDARDSFSGLAPLGGVNIYESAKNHFTHNKLEYAVREEITFRYDKFTGYPLPLPAARDTPLCFPPWEFSY